MGSASGRPAASVRDKLFERPAAFRFFQAVRLLKLLRAGEGTVDADDPDDEIVRFRSQVSLSFPPADITDLVDFGTEGRAAVMEVAFMGMAAAESFGSLPQCYTEKIYEEAKEKNYALRDFLDLFNHRFVSHFYRAWEKYNVAVSYECGEGSYYERAIFGLIGMGTGGLRNRLALEDRALLSRGGLLKMAPVPASALEGLVESYFRVPVRTEQFLPGWYNIDEGDQNRLGRTNSRLGDDLFMGESVELCEFRFGLRIGPLDWDRYRDFFPDTEGYAALHSLVKLAVPPETDFQCRMVLQAEDVPDLRLEHTPSQACRLGWSTWLHSDEPRNDADDAVLAGDPFVHRAPAQPC